MFYNTGIATYIWVLSNHKESRRKGKIQLIDATNLYQRMRKALGSKRKELNGDHINQIINLYGDFKDSKSKDLAVSQIFDSKQFGYTTITLESPILDDKGKAVLGENTSKH
jgi:type I restriction enzyme M protein